MLDGGRPPSGREPDVAFFKQTVAKAIVLRTASSTCRELFKVFPGHITLGCSLICWKRLIAL